MTSLYNPEASSGSGEIVVKRVASVTVNLQVTTRTTVYTVPSGYIYIPLFEIVRGATATPDDIVCTFGFNVDANDVGTIQDLNSLTSSLRAVQAAGTGSLTVALQRPRAIGQAGATLAWKMPSANTNPATAIIDVIGYLVPV